MESTLNLLETIDTNRIKSVGIVKNKNTWKWLLLSILFSTALYLIYRLPDILSILSEENFLIQNISAISQVLTAIVTFISVRISGSFRK